MKNNLIKTILAVICVSITGNALAMDAGKRERSDVETVSVDQNAQSKQRKVVDPVKRKPNASIGLWKTSAHKAVAMAIRNDDLGRANKTLEAALRPDYQVYYPFPFDLDALVGPEKMTLLHRAACFNRLDIAKLLIEKGASLDVNMKNGDTALDIAAKRGHENFVLYLKERGARVPAWVERLHDTELDEDAPGLRLVALKNAENERDLADEILDYENAVQALALARLQNQ